MGRANRSCASLGTIRQPSIADAWPGEVRRDSAQNS